MQALGISRKKRRALLTLKCRALAAPFFAAASAHAGGIPCGYEVAHVIQAPYCAPFGYPPTAGIGISPNGRYVCGFYNACVVGQPRAFVYDTTTEQFFTVPHPPGITSASARSVNDAGIVCGTAINSAVGDQGFVYDLNSGLWTPLPSQAVTSGWSFANAINSNNVVAGFRSVDDGGSPTNPRTAFRWHSSSGFDDLGLINGQTTEGYDINDNDVVTGKMGIGNGTRPILWIDRSIVDLGSLADMETVPSALNNLNQVVGASRVPLPGSQFGVSHAFYWSDGVMVDVGTLPGHNLSAANDINDDSIVIGTSAILGISSNRGFLWSNGVIHDINDLVQNSPLNIIESCVAISASGHVISGGNTASFDFVSIVLVPSSVSPADLNGTCTVNVDDLLTVINEWGKTKSVADINKDEIVNYLDLVIVIENWTFN